MRVKARRKGYALLRLHSRLASVISLLDANHYVRHAGPCLPIEATNACCIATRFHTSFKSQCRKEPRTTETSCPGSRLQNSAVHWPDLTPSSRSRLLAVEGNLEICVQAGWHSGADEKVTPLSTTERGETLLYYIYIVIYYLVPVCQ
jgi:hypothetical protein